ncbi:MAG: type III-B CRISPR module RAMP protein Cmr1 [Desulfobulbus sp.]|nr:type III-B CRISPR module RAMP protein Cmr1 [Desulfobulbus sp.]
MPMINSAARTYRLTALTDLWTGDINGKSNRLITTGLLGSIRWWFEVLVRGLGGSACDPTDTKCEGRNHCVVCELFGCTGWARKFRFEVLDENGKARTKQIKKDEKSRDEKSRDEKSRDEKFSLRFTPLRPIQREEWALLDITLCLIAEYGAIGGKTVFKPTYEPGRLKEKHRDEPGRSEKTHHQDYGLVQMVTPRRFAETRRDDLEKYLSKWKKPNHGKFAWASLQHFWHVDGKYLGRIDNSKSTFNQVLGRQEAKRQGQKLLDPNDSIAKWLAGSQQESKKVFSFKNPARTFGFVKPGKTAAETKKEFEEMKKRLDSAWGQNGWDFLDGDKIIDQLFTEKEGRS